MKYLTFALAKGRLAECAAALFEKADMAFGAPSDKKTRKLFFTDEKNGRKFFLAKADDVPIYTEYGAADVGVCGKDTLLEQKRALYEVLDLGFGACVMVIAGPKGSEEKLRNGSGFKVATKYPAIATRAFREKNQSVEIIKLHGSVELAPNVGLADFIVDITETGATLRENGLCVFEELMPLSARLVVNRVSLKTEHAKVVELIEKLKGAIQ